MKLTKKLLSLLHRVFDPDPEQFLALRMRYGGTMTWTVAEGVLTTSVVGGIGQGFSIDLTTVTITQLVAYISARPGYQVLYVDGSGNQSLSARVLIDGTGNIAQSNGDHLYGYTSLTWVYLEAIGTELKAAKAQIPEAIKQMSVPTASSDWIDELGAYYGVPRLQGETDQSYGARIIAETVRPRSNNVAMERAISYYTGQATKVTDVTIYGAAFPKYNGAITRNSAYQYQPQSTPKYGLFDVEIGYDLLGGTDQSAFADVVSGIVEQLRSAGTHMRALSMQAGAISDAFTPPTDNSPMTIVATPVLTETLTAPTEGTFAFNSALTVMSDTATPGTEPQAFDAIKYGYCYNGVRTRNGAIKYAGGTVETNPVVTKEWSFLTGTLPSDVTFTRASTGTRMNVLGLLEVVGADQPRLDYAPSGVPMGLLIEGSSTNLMKYSEQMDTLWVGPGVTVTPDATAAPDGSLTADKLVETAVAGSHYLDQVCNGTFTMGQVFCGSFFLKAGERTSARLNFYYAIGGAGGVAIYFDLVNKTVLSQYANVLDSGVVDMGDGWLRCWFTAAVDTTAETRLLLRLMLCNTGINSSYTGDGTSGFYAWGAQVEAGLLTSYIPTTSATATRADDVASINTLSPWYNATEGTLRLEVTDRQPAAGAFTLSIGADGQNYIGMGYSTVSAAMGTCYIKNANAGGVMTDTASNRTRLVLAWDGASASLATDSAYRDADTNAGVPPASSMWIGRGHFGGGIISGHYRKIAYWNKRFPDNTLATLA